MKQKAKIYKGKRVVMGDKNRVTKHEIHVNDIPQEGGESGGGNSGGNSGGGTELEGEYFLVTPIEKYWKVRFINDRNFDIDSLSEEQKEALGALHMIIATYGIAYSTTKCYINPPSWFDFQINNPMEASGNAGFGYARISYDKMDSLDSAIMNNDFIRMFREAHIKSSETYLSVLGIYEYDLLTIMRLLLEDSLGTSLTDDEVTAMISEMLMIDPVTKEEYESSRLE